MSQSALATQPAVAVQDAGGNTVTTSTSPVTLALTAPGGATLACTTNPKAAVAGVATFAGCQVDKVGSYTLTASAAGLTSGTSSSFTITVGAAAKVAFTTQPGGGASQVAWATQPVVAVQDAGGNTVTTDTSSVTLTLTTPGGATLACTREHQGRGRRGRDVRGLQGRQVRQLHADRHRRGAGHGGQQQLHDHRRRRRAS